MFAKILFSEELLVNKLCRRALCAITALLFVLCSLPAGARTETEAGGITSYAEDSNGVVEYEIDPCTVHRLVRCVFNHQRGTDARRNAC